MDIFAPQFSLAALLVALLVGFVLGRLRFSNAREKNQSADDERERLNQLRLAFRQLPADKRQPIEKLLREGKFIEAVRDVRLALNCGLKDAKDIASELQQQAERH